MKSTAQIFSENLKSRRKELGLTQQRLGELIGYSEKSISKWENGSAIAPSAVLPALARHLLTDIDSLLYCPEEPSYYLGIDGGGTKTDFMLVSENGDEISHITLGASNPVDIGMNKALEVLSSGIEAVCGDIAKQKISVFAGIAGGITGDNKKKIRSFLGKYRFARVDNGSDAQNAVASALGNENGTVVIVGTGVVAFSQIDGILHRRGGFGYLFEEGGSGYAIGRDAIIAALKDEEGSAESTMITSLLKEKLSCGGLLGKLSHFYDGGKREIASYSPLVYKAFKHGDSVAKEILERNMACVARLIESTPKTSNRAKKQSVALTGGQTRDAEVIIPLISKYLSRPSDYDLTVNRLLPVHGALILSGLKEIKGENDA